MPSGADLEYQKMLKAAGIDPFDSKGKDGAYLEQLGDEKFSVTFDSAGNFTPASAAALKASFAAPQVMLFGAGIDYTGATDSTTAIQAMITSAPQGAWIMAQAGVLKFSSLTLDKGKRLIGTGWQFYRDAGTTFGDAAYLNNAHFGGTVLRSTATSGVAVTLVDTQVTGGALEGFILVGPGTGTAVGVAVGSSTQSVIDPDLDIGISNFALGLRTRNVNEGAVKAVIRGCTKGASYEGGTNNVKVDLNVQKCVDGASTDSTTLALTFLSPLMQSNTGTGLIINGTAHVVVNPYSESLAGVRAIDFVSGDRHTLITPSLNTTPDTVRVQAAATNARIIGMDPARLVDQSTSTITDTPRSWVPVVGGVGFQNSYANSAGKTTKFRRSPNGAQLEVTGGVVTGANGAVIFTLPAECRPFSPKGFVSSNASQGTVVQGTVAQNGDVKIFGGIGTDERHFDFIIPLDT